MGSHAFGGTLTSKRGQKGHSTYDLSFLITIEFRAFIPYGVVFFATNTSTGQVISLELVAGKLVYQFNSGGGLVQTATTQDYGGHVSPVSPDPTSMIVPALTRLQGGTNVKRRGAKLRQQALT